MKLCHHSTLFNISTTAGFYSTVAGVMAGFAFISLFYLITTDEKVGKPSKDDGLGAQTHKYNLAGQALGAAFIALLLSSITYAILAGEPAPGGRASTDEVIAGVGFALAAIQLFYAIVLMIRAQQREVVPLQRFFQTLGGTFLCPLAYLLVQLGVSDYREAADDHAGNLIYYGGWILLLVLLVVIVGAWWQPKCRPKLPPLLNPSYWTVGVGAVGIVATSVLSVVLNECAVVAPLIMAGILVLAFLVLLNQALWFFTPPVKFHEFQRPRPSPEPEPT